MARREYSSPVAPSPRPMGFLLAVGGLALGLLASLRGDVVLPDVIFSGMVLQREREVPIWGSADPGERVVVRFRGQTVPTVADADGKWMVRLSALAPGGPHAMEITGKNKMLLDDILVGDVWVGSGQSNMDSPCRLYRADDPGLEAILARAPFAGVRLFKSNWHIRENLTYLFPGEDEALYPPGWRSADPKSIDRFSALLFVFGLRLSEVLGIPIGLIEGSAGGSPSGCWIPDEDYRADPACQADARRFSQTYNWEKAKAEHRAIEDAWARANETAQAAGQPPVPRPRGHRRNPPAAAGEASFPIGIYFQQFLGMTVPFGIKGVLWDQGESGTAITGVGQHALMGALIRSWRRLYQSGDFPFLYVQKPSGQGPVFKDPETGRFAPGVPIGPPVNRQVQRVLTEFEPLPESPPATTGSMDRETYVRLMEHPNTFMVTASDLPGGTHPADKSLYGNRAARVALGAVYSRPVNYLGPIFAGMTIERDKIRLRFDHVGGGLVACHSQRLQGFAIAGADRQFHWAEAEIVGDTVLVHARSVSRPVAVRYAWGQRISWANLFNRDGLPAPTFRTDDW